VFTEQVIRRGCDEEERGIIALLIEKKIYGLKISNAEIGARHGVSESTVRRVRDWVHELLGDMLTDLKSKLEGRSDFPRPADIRRPNPK